RGAVELLEHAIEGLEPAWCAVAALVVAPVAHSSATERHRADCDDRLASGVGAAKHRDHACARARRCDLRELLRAGGRDARDRLSDAAVILDEDLDVARAEPLA